MPKLRSVVVAVVCLAVTGCLARVGPHGGPQMRRDDDGRQHEKDRDHEKDRRHGGDDRGGERGRD